MRQFYIPTSSLNFNNIFSTESISPAAFYALRGFGYSRWTTIPENEVENAILLYDSPCNFERPASDLEDHPMLIEIRTDEEFPQIGEGLFYSDHTIYLNPWNTRIWFYNDKDKRTALSLSDSSLETKTLRLYNNSISLGRFEKDYMPVQISQEIPLNSERMEFDKLINRYKGLLYGYYIGAAKSITPERAELIHMLYTVQDTFMAIAASPDKKATPSQLETLSAIFDALKERSEFMIDLVNITESKEKALEIVRLLERVGAKTPLDNLDLAHHLSNLRFDQNSDGSSLKWIRYQLEKVFEKAEIHLLHPDDSQIVVADNQLITLKYSDDQLQTALFKDWANSVFLNPEFNGKISSRSFNLATAILTKAKEHIGDEEWDNSPIRTYLNILRHLVNGEETDFRWENDILSAVSAVIYKGDDWDKLLRFMQNQNMSDYRIAFATYGQLNGFANLTRDFTDVILNQPSEYVANVYMEFYGQLFAKEICKDKMPQLSVVTPALSPIEQEPYHPVQQDNLGVELVTRRAFAIYHSPAFAKIAKPNLEVSLMEALMAYNGTDNVDDFMAYLAGYDGWKKTNKPWRSLYELLGGVPNLKAVKKVSAEPKRKSASKSKDHTLSLFDDSAPIDIDLFYVSPKVEASLKALISPRPWSEIEWFFKDLRKPAQVREYYKKIDVTNNKWVIDTFCKSSRIVEILGAKKIEEIRTFFYNMYGIR